MINNIVNIIETTEKILLYLDGKIPFTKNGFPVFSQDMFLCEEPDLIVPYYHRNNKIVKDPQKTVICFFDNDLFLYRRLEKIFDDLDEYKRFQGVIGLDLTITEDMDSEWQDAVMLLNQLFLAVLAHNKIKIIMNSRIGSSASLKNLYALPKNLMWATSFLGCTNLKSETDFSFITKILRLLPSKILIYGKHDIIAEKQLSTMGIPFRNYPDYHRLSKGVA